jgi:glycosyltransferase involved in cell wall biosynthesis
MVTRDYPPKVGGIATYAWHLSKELEGLGVDVDVFSGSSDAGTLLLTLRKDFGDYDLVHVLSAPYGALVRGAPFVLTVHSPVATEVRYYGSSLKAKAIPASRMEAIALFRARAVIAVSRATHDDLAVRHPYMTARVFVVPNGVDLERYRAPERKSRGPLRILLVGRLEPRKNFREAILALAPLPNSSYVLEVAGSGSREGELKALAVAAGVNARFLGWVPPSDLPSLYARADMFVSSSRSEGFGLTILEAMASGCATVASDIPAHRELLEPGRAGILYHDTKELGEAIKTMAEDRELVATVARSGNTHASRFSWGETARRTLEVYEAETRSR